MIEFLKDWQAYRAGRTAEESVLGGGVVDVLTRRGIVRPLAPAVAGDAVIAAPPMAGKTIGGPKKPRKPKPARR